MPEISGLYLQGEERGAGEGGEKWFREREINISLDFVVLIFKMINYTFNCCCFRQKKIFPYMMSSSHVENTT